MNANNYRGIKNVNFGPTNHGLPYLVVSIFGIIDTMNGSVLDYVHNRHFIYAPSIFTALTFDLDHQNFWKKKKNTGTTVFGTHSLR